jgi:hypothetical protein
LRIPAPDQIAAVKMTFLHGARRLTYQASGVSHFRFQAATDIVSQEGMVP